jgi:outer membrane protein
LVLLAFASGCVDQDKEVALYRSVLDGPTSRPVSYTRGAPLTLATALLLTNQHNERLAIGGEDYVQALIEKDRAASRFLPTISLSPSYSKADAGTDTRNRFGSGGSGTDDPNDPSNRVNTASTGDGRLDVPVNANVNVFNGLRDYYNIQRARGDIRRFRALLLDLQSAVMLDVARAYYQVLRAERSVEVLRNSVKLQDERVRDIRTRDRIGAARKLDVAQIEAQAAAFRATLIAAQADAHNARVLLAFLVGAPVLDAPLDDRYEVPELSQSIGATIEEAWNSRQDLAAAEAAIEAAAANVQSAVGQYYPSVSINFNYYLSRESQPEDSLWNGLISANLPLFTGGLIRANVRLAMSQLRQAKLQQSLLLRQIEQDVRFVYENLAASTARMVELRLSADAAEQALTVSEGEYRAGRITNLDRLVAQDRLLAAQLDLVGEEFNRKVSYLNLLRVAGRLNRPLVERLNETPATRPAATRPADTRPATTQAVFPARLNAR